MTPRRLRQFKPMPGDFWDVAAEQLVYWRTTGVTTRDCMITLGRDWAARPTWAHVFRALLIDAALMQGIGDGVSPKSAGTPAVQRSSAAA